MSAEWSQKTLKECATWYSGGTPRKSNPDFWDGAIPWISAKSLTEFFIQDSDEKVSELGAKNGTRLMPAETILFVVRGMSLKNEFRLGITNRPVTFNQDLKALVAREWVLPLFLAYAIRSRSNEILGMVGEAGHGTGVLPTDRIESLKILIPEISEQERIVHILKTLDNKIELNRQINQTLEEIAQALFKSWFVDFEPTKAKIKAKRSSQCPPLPPGEGPGVRAPLPPDLLNNARRLRQQLTDAERLLWQLLRGRQLAGCKFRRQHPIGNFILDFYCHDKQLAVELDGGQHNDPNQREADERRAAWLAEQGIKVLRFWNNEVLQETEGVLEEIFRHLTGPAPHPRPLSRGERGEAVVADFVERAAMCAISGKTDDELDRLPAEQFAQLRDTAALFPDELVESELGMIPEGWAWKSLDAIAHYQNGLALQKYRPKDNFDFLPIVKIAQLKAGVATSEEKASPDITPACIIDNGDVVFSWSGSLMVDIWCGGKAALNQHLFKVTSEACPKWFYYHWTQYHLAKFQQIAADKAVTMGHIKREHLHEAMCAVPNFDPEDLHIMTQLIERQVAARLENNSLTQLRDTLLTKLLSGEISVNKAGEDIKEAI